LKFRREQKIIAKEYDLEPMQLDNLRQEDKFLIEKDEIKMKFFPAVWYSTNKHHLDNPNLIEGIMFPNIHRASILVTNKRIILPIVRNNIIKEISIWFPDKINNKSDKIRFVFSSLNENQEAGLSPSLKCKSLVLEYLDTQSNELMRNPSLSIGFEEKSMVLGVFINLFPYDFNEFKSTMGKAHKS